MAFYDKFPYTNFQELNLDRLIQELIKVKEGLDFVIENASLKYADPIQWNITHQYAANTVVIDPETGIAYISTKPVPDNILITNTGYWTPIFDLSQFFDETETQIEALQTAIDALNSTTETQSADIQDLKDDTEAQAQDITNIQGNITNIQSDIDNMQSEIDNIEISISGNPVNVLTLGVKNDGSEDVSAIVNQATRTSDLYFPAGTYLFNSPFIPEHSVIGAGHTRIEPGITIFKMNFNTDSVGVIDFTNCLTYEPRLVRDISIDCTAGPGYGIKYAPAQRILLELRNITISNNKNWAIYVAPTSNTSRPVYARNISIKADGNNGGNGIYLSENANDCDLSDLEIMYVDIAIASHGGLLRLNNAHLFGGRETSSIAQINQHWPSTVGVDAYDTVMADNIYIDSFFQGWVQRKNGSSIGNLTIWYDTWMTGASRTDGTGVRLLDVCTVTIDNLISKYCEYISQLYFQGVTVKSNTYYNLPSFANIVSHGRPVMMPGNFIRSNPHFADTGSYYTMIGILFASRSNAGRCRGYMYGGSNEIYQITANTGTANTLKVTPTRISGGRDLYYKKLGMV